MFIQQNIESFLSKNFNEYQKTCEFFPRYISLSYNDVYLQKYTDQLNKIKSKFDKGGYMTNADFVSLLTILKVKCKFIDDDVGQLSKKNDDKYNKKIKLMQSQKKSIEEFIKRLEIALRDRFNCEDMNIIFESSVFDDKLDFLNKIINIWSTNSCFKLIHGNMESVLDNFCLKFDEINSKFDDEELKKMFDEYRQFVPEGWRWFIKSIVASVVLLGFSLFGLEYNYGIFRGFDSSRVRNLDDAIKNDEFSLWCEDAIKSDAFVTSLSIMLIVIYCLICAYIAYLFTPAMRKSRYETLKKNFGVDVLRIGLFQFIDTLVDVINNKKPRVNLMKICDKICADMLFDSFVYDSEKFENLNKQMLLLAQLNKFSETIINDKQIDMNSENVKNIIIKFLKDIQNNGVYSDDQLDELVKNILSKSEVQDSDAYGYANVRYIVELIAKCGDASINLDLICNKLFEGIDFDNLEELDSINRDLTLDNTTKELSDILKKLISDDFDKDQDGNELFEFDNDRFDDILKYHEHVSSSINVLKGDFKDKRQMSLLDNISNGTAFRDMNKLKKLKHFVYSEYSNVKSYGELLEKCDIQYYLDMLLVDKDDEYKGHVEFLIKNRYLFKDDVLKRCINENVLSLDEDIVFKRIFKRNEIKKLLDKWCNTKKDMVYMSLIEKSKDFVIVSLISEGLVFKNNTDEVFDNKFDERMNNLLGSLYKIINLLDVQGQTNGIDDVLGKCDDLENVLIFCDYLLKKFFDENNEGVPVLKDNIDNILNYIRGCEFDFWKEVLKNGYENIGIYKRSFDIGGQMKNNIINSLIQHNKFCDKNVTDPVDKKSVVAKSCNENLFSNIDENIEYDDNESIKLFDKDDSVANIDGGEIYESDFED